MSEHPHPEIADEDGNHHDVDGDGQAENGCIVGEGCV